MEDMSGVALLTRIKDLAERLARVEKLTVYKVGFWASSGAWIIKLFGLFKLMGF